MHLHNLKPLAIALAVAGLSACATVPRDLAGQFTALTPQQASDGGASGARVRWGGEIIQTEPARDQTCFYVLGKPLDTGDARPIAHADSIGRFVACRQGFYDPEVYAKGRELTVAGVLQGTVVKKVGDYDYPYPRVVADAMHLWPVRMRYARQPDPFYDPFWGPWYNPWWGGPFGYGFGPPVYVVRQAPPPPPPPPPPPK
jgi:outer membrane lipoprotein